MKVIREKQINSKNRTQNKWVCATQKIIFPRIFLNGSPIYTKFRMKSAKLGDPFILCSFFAFCTIQSSHSLHLFLFFLSFFFVYTYIIPKSKARVLYSIHVTITSKGGRAFTSDNMAIARKDPTIAK